MNYEFDRKLPELARRVSGNISVTMPPEDLKQFQALGNVNCTDTPYQLVNITLPKLVPSRVRLGEKPVAEPLIIDDNSYENVHDVTVRYSCQNFWMLRRSETPEETPEINAGIDL